MQPSEAQCESNCGFRKEMNYEYPKDTIELLQAVAKNISNPLSTLLTTIDINKLWENICQMYETWEKSSKKNNANNKYNNDNYDDDTDEEKNSEACTIKDAHEEAFTALLALLRSTTWFSADNSSQLLDMLLCTVAPKNSFRYLFPEQALIPFMEECFLAEDIKVRYFKDGLEITYKEAKYRSDKAICTPAHTAESAHVDGTLYLHKEALYIVESDGMRQDYYGIDTPTDLYSLYMALNNSDWEIRPDYSTGEE